ncbi:hypothetical protein JHD50_01025 [Sulfurimonas sp. MAG313]|nr:hypothetical protein [Sulfurimonas sp. MAG313]MDF1879893.1 hypothetical protein [Sulfurimonas sp. MAG313]
MLSYLYITEKEIKKALKEGFITAKEARSMLLVYFRKENFTPIIDATEKYQVA